jgi:hypothetical protein
MGRDALPASSPPLLSKSIMTPGELRERLEKNPADLERLRHAHDCTWNVDAFVEAIREPAQEWKICEVLGVLTEVDKTGRAASGQFFLSLAVGLITLLIISAMVSAAFLK